MEPLSGAVYPQSRELRPEIIIFVGELALI